LHKLILPHYVPGVDVWRLELDLEAPLTDADWSTLGADERDRALKFLRQEDRVRYAATRSALRRLLSQIVAREPEQLCFVTNDFGKPSLQTKERVEFNVSHSGRYSIIAISTDSAVGIDIEQCSQDLDVTGLAPQVLSSNELPLIKDKTAFVKRWVLKESILKALGLGISDHLQTISAERADALNGPYTAHHPTLDVSAVRACALPAPSGYFAALAWFER